MADETSRTEENKAVVTAFIEQVNRDGFDVAVAALPADCTWWLGGVTRSRDEMAEVVGFASQVLVGWGRYEITAVTAEEDRVALEAVSHAELKNGRHYSNSYHFLFRMRNGEIAEVREHCDTKYAADTMFPTAVSGTEAAP